jgi:hypothetical protein
MTEKFKAQVPWVYCTNFKSSALLSLLKVVCNKMVPYSQSLYFSTLFLWCFSNIYFSIIVKLCTFVYYVYILMYIHVCMKT